MTKPFDIVIAGELNLDLILYGLPTHMRVRSNSLLADFAPPSAAPPPSSRTTPPRSERASP